MRDVLERTGQVTLSADLCVAHRLRFERGGDPEDLERAILFGRQALSALSALSDHRSRGR